MCPPIALQEKASALAVPSTDPEAEERRRREAEEQRMAELRRHGTPVTPEAFAAWKARFDAEMVRLGGARLAAPESCSAVAGCAPGRPWRCAQPATLNALAPTAPPPLLSLARRWSGQSWTGRGARATTRRVGRPARPGSCSRRRRTSRCAG